MKHSLLDDLIQVTPMEEVPKGELFYMDIQLSAFPTGAQSLSGREQLSIYEQEYEHLKNLPLFTEEAKTALLKAIYCRMNRIRKYYCE